MDATLATTAADPTNDKLGDSAALVPRAFGECVDVEELLVGEPAVVVSGTVPSEVTASQILLKGSAKDSKRIAGVECAVDIVPMTFDYQLGGDTLTLTAQGQSLPLTRVK